MKIKISNPIISQEELAGIVMKAVTNGNVDMDDVEVLESQNISMSTSTEKNRYGKSDTFFTISCNIKLSRETVQSILESDIDDESNMSVTVDNILPSGDGDFEIVINND